MRPAGEIRFSITLNLAHCRLHQIHPEFRNAMHGRTGTRRKQERTQLQKHANPPIRAGLRAARRRRDKV